MEHPPGRQHQPTGRVDCRLPPNDRSLEHRCVTLFDDSSTVRQEVSGR